MLFDKEDEGRVQEFIAELRSMNLTVEGMVEDYDRLIALYDVSFFFRIYLRSCAQALHDRAFEKSQSSLSAGRYIQFFEGELTTMPRMIYLFQSAYGSRFIRSVYQASYLTFIERQQQATNFLKKCVAEHDKFSFFRKTIATIEDNQLIEEPKILNPRIKGKPHNRPINNGSHVAGSSQGSQKRLADHLNPNLAAVSSHLSPLSGQLVNLSEDFVNFADDDLDAWDGLDNLDSLKGLGSILDSRSTDDD